MSEPTLQNLQGNPSSSVDHVGRPIYERVRQTITSSDYKATAGAVFGLGVILGKTRWRPTLVWKRALQRRLLPSHKPISRVGGLGQSSFMLFAGSMGKSILRRLDDQDGESNPQLNERRALLAYEKELQDRGVSLADVRQITSEIHSQQARESRQRTLNAAATATATLVVAPLYYPLGAVPFLAAAMALATDAFDTLLSESRTKVDVTGRLAAMTVEEVRSRHDEALKQGKPIDLVLLEGKRKALEKEMSQIGHDLLLIRRARALERASSKVSQ